jgi:hypothetical protein
MTILTDREKELLEQISVYLDEAHLEGSKQMNEQLVHLENLGAAVAQYPIVRSAQLVWGKYDSSKMLEDIAIPSNKLYLPSRVVVTESLLIAKLQTFSVLSAMIQGIEGFCIPLRNSIFSIICVLMAEKVYFSCLEDPHFPANSKELLANDLISLWDSATDPRGERYFQPLEQLWQARDMNPPVYGTMDGTSEIIRVGMDLPDYWDGFLKEEAGGEETAAALDEFVFGLSFEDITKVRERMKRMEVTAINLSDFAQYFTSITFMYKAIKNSDPRTFYNFFIERRNQAQFRKRISEQGPQRTLEEIYLEYLVGLSAT